jgi:hypothetical protein
MSRAIERRVEALERPRMDSISVWFPDEPKPGGWDTAAIQVEFPDHEVSR